MPVTSFKMAAIITLVALAGAAPKGNDGKPREKTNKMFPDGLVHDFGALPRGPEAQHVFRIVNTSKVPLRITKWGPAGCCPMTVRVAKTLLQPNEEGKVVIRLETTRFAGSKIFAGFVTTNDGKRIEFRIYATALQDPTRR